MLECVSNEVGPGGHEYPGGLFAHILTNVGTAIGTLRNYGYTGPVVVLGFYNPESFVLAESDTLQKALNEAFESYIGANAFGPGVTYGNPFPIFNPQGNKVAEEKAICRYTEWCNKADIQFNEETKPPKKVTSTRRRSATTRSPKSSGQPSKPQG